MGFDFGIGEAALLGTALEGAGTGAAIGTGTAGVAAAATPGIASLIGSSTPWLAYGGLAASGLSAATGAVGAATSGAAARQAAQYNAQIAGINQQVSEQNAIQATQAGEQQAGMSQQKTRATVGAIKAGQAASGVDINSGSAVDVRSSAAQLGELDAINIRANAARTAYGYGNQAAGFGAQAQLDKLTGENAGVAGDIGAATTFLGGAGNAALNWQKWNLSSGGGFAA